MVEYQDRTGSFVIIARHTGGPVSGEFGRAGEGHRLGRFGKL